MPTFSLESNLGAFKAAGEEKQNRFLEAVQKSIALANLKFISEIQNRQMSFSRDQAPTLMGTRWVTGRLRNNWYQSALATGKSILTRVWSTTKYMPMHENATKDGTPTSGVYTIAAHSRRNKNGTTSVVRAHTIHMPKRLRVGEAWEKNYPRMARAAVDMAFKATIGRA